MDVRTPIANNGGEWITKFGDAWKKQIEELKSKFGASIEEVRMPGTHSVDVPVIYVQKNAIIDVLKFAKEAPSFEYDFLSDLTATDEQVEPRFELVYNLYSMKNHYRIRFKTRVREGEEVATLTSVWAGANWAEREVWDMFGVKFAGHPDLRRILMDERWQGFPLRKDYPLRGYQLFTEPMKAHEELLD
jgi:NADH-quinone oxidoreductase subunit C